MHAISHEIFDGFQPFFLRSLNFCVIWFISHFVNFTTFVCLVDLRNYQTNDYGKSNWAGLGTTFGYEFLFLSVIVRIFLSIDILWRHVLQKMVEYLKFFKELSLLIRANRHEKSTTSTCNLKAIKTQNWLAYVTISVWKLIVTPIYDKMRDFKGSKT